MNKKNTKAPKDTLPVVPAGEKASPFLRGFAAFRKMKKTSRPRNETALEAVVTARIIKETVQHALENGDGGAL